MAGFCLYYLEQAGLTGLAVNTHHLPKTVEAAVSCFTYEKSYPVHFLQEDPILGSGGGICNAKKYLNGEEAFVVMNGDEIIFHPESNFLRSMIESHKKSGALCTMLTIPHPEAGKLFPALRINDQNEITEISVKDDSADLVHNCGVYVYSPKVFDFMPSGKKNIHIFKDCLIPAMARGEKIMSHPGHKDMLWLDASGVKEYLKSTETAVELLQSGGATAKTLNSILDRFHQGIQTKSTDEAFVILAQDAQLSDAAKVKGFVILGAGANFEQGSIENTVIAPNVHIQETTHLKNQLIL